MQEWIYPIGNLYPREWPIAWDGIDGDEVIEHEGIPVPGSLADCVELVDTPVKKQPETGQALDLLPDSLKEKQKPDGAKEQSKPDAVKVG